MKHLLCALLVILTASLLAGCSSLLANNLPTPLPQEYLPTAIALTSEAGRGNPTTPLAESASGTGVPGQSPAGKPLSTGTPAPSDTPIPFATATPYPITLPPTFTATPASKVPPAPIQIFNPGDLSKVASPLHISAFLRPGAVGRVRIELMGEDGRVLAEELRILTTNPFAWANLTLDLDFQISAAAEVGRLVIAVDDEAGRTIGLNSVDLILLSMGDSDINPPSATQEAIIIQQPVAKVLIQGGKVLVSGTARTVSDRPLMAELRDDKNKVVGMRLVGVSAPDADGYRTFAAEVPYQVSALTPVRLVVYEEGDKISKMLHLSSLEIMLSR